VVCLSVIVKPRYSGSPGPTGAVAPLKKIAYYLRLVVSEKRRGSGTNAECLFILYPEDVGRNLFRNLVPIVTATQFHTSQSFNPNTNGRETLKYYVIILHLCKLSFMFRSRDSSN
jgi:hypothetical protein